MLAAHLAADARRLLARLESVETRLDGLSAVGALTESAEAEGMRLLVSIERALNAVRSTLSNLVARFPATEPGEVDPARFQTIADEERKQK